MRPHESRRACMAVCNKRRIYQYPLNVIGISGGVSTVPSSVRTSEPQLAQLCFNRSQHISKMASELHSACVALASRRAVSDSGERCMSRYASLADVAL